MKKAKSLLLAIAFVSVPMVTSCASSQKGQEEPMTELESGDETSTVKGKAGAGHKDKLKKAKKAKKAKKKE